jgi:hypothetical protein
MDRLRPALDAVRRVSYLAGISEAIEKRYVSEYGEYLL